MMPICANATLQCSKAPQARNMAGCFDCGSVGRGFDGDEEAGIDGNEIAKMFLDSNPQMAQSFRTIGARGPNVWFITHSPCPSKTWLFDANGVKVADFQEPRISNCPRTPPKRRALPRLGGCTGARDRRLKPTCGLTTSAWLTTSDTQGRKAPFR